MTVDSFYLYSVISVNENQNGNDMLKILELTNTLHGFGAASEVKDWLKSNWKLKDDINNFFISRNVKLSTKTNEKYFNVVLEEDKKVSSFRFVNDSV